MEFRPVGGSSPALPTATSVLSGKGGGGETVGLGKECDIQ